MANPDRSMLPPAAEPKMAMIHEEVNAVIFGCDRVWMFLGNVLQNAGAFHIEFVSASGTLLGPDLPSDNERTFLSEALQRFEDVLGELTLHRNALDHAAAIADDREDDLAGLAQIIEPASDLHSLANMLSCVCDPDSDHRISAGAYGVRISRDVRGRISICTHNFSLTERQEFVSPAPGLLDGMVRV